MKGIPETGVVGRAFVEAATTEYRQVIDLVRAALGKKLSPNGEGVWVCVEAIYPDRVIMEKEGRYWAYPYALAEDNTVQLGDPQEVIEQYVPVAMREAAAFIEAVAEADGGGEKKNILTRIVRAGLSKNRIFYPDAVLRESANLFEGARVFVKGDKEHLEGGGKDFTKLVGKITDVRFIAGYAPDNGELRGVFRPIEPDGAVAVKLREAVNNKMADLFGVSIDADGTATRPRDRSQPRVAKTITKVNSVDIIVEPGAGGEFIRLAEAFDPQTQSEDAMRTRMIEAVKAKHGGALPAGLNVEDDNALETAYREAIAPAPQPQAGGDIDERLRMIEARQSARLAIASSTLPQPAKDRLLGDFDARVSFREADVAAAIEGERAYLARFVEAGRVVGLGDGRVEPGEDRADKLKTMWDDFFDPSKSSVSLRECYIETTGDRGVTGLVRNCDPIRLREAAGANFREAVSAATFNDILGDSITRALVRDYAGLEAYGDYGDLVDIVPIRDFRTNERTRLGGYGNLPAVAENGAYGALASPTDEKATYAVSKRGGTETVSLETIANDDVGVIRRIPMALAMAAKRTLYEFVLDFLATNPTIYDATALFTVGHGNLGTAALSATSFAARRLAMKQRTEKDSGKKLGIILRHLYVPAELEEAAFDLFVKGTNNDETFVQSRKPRVHVVDYWTDADNWYATADKATAPLIELGFFNGVQEPELFTQDLPTQGSLFSNDQIKYKIRHIYGGNVLDFRGFDGSVVA